MIPLSLGSIAQIVHGDLVMPDPGDEADDAPGEHLMVTADVVTDSRRAAPGSLYVARVGEHADGHDFAADAAARGAVAALSTRPLPDLPAIVVADTQDAFAALARAVVDASDDLVVVGLTGSSGKTSTKDLLGQVLATHGPTIAPEGSFNSEVGVPLTVCRVRPDTAHLVVEMGARGRGHIAYLTSIAPPDIGIVLNVGTAHLGEFGSVEAIGRAKSELPAAVPAGGVVILNADDPVVVAMASQTTARVLLTSAAGAQHAHVRASDITLDDAARARFTVHTPTGRAEVRLPVSGRHQVDNALAVVAAALECGMDLAAVVSALADLEPISRWRMEVTTRADGVTVVNDAYNANPDSTRAALDALASMRAGRRLAVLGGMLELGQDCRAHHAAVGRHTAATGVDGLVVVGELARPLADAAGEAGVATSWVPNTDAAYDVLAGWLRPGDVVLFKSSRDVGLRWLGERVAQQRIGHREDTP